MSAGLALAFVLPACAEVSPLGPLTGCSETAAPVRTDEVVAALREHGFSVKPDPFGCGGAADIHIIVSNATEQESYDANKAEGLVSCAVRSHSLSGDLVSIETQKGGPILSPKVFGDVLNVDCQLGDGDHLPSAAQVARLRAALEQMMGARGQS